jgi:hypothetical protein
MKKPWTDPNPQLGRPSIARRFEATEAQPVAEAPTIVKRSKGHGRVALPKVMKASDLPPPAPKSKAPKSAKAKKRGRPATGKTPWIDAGVSRATYFRRQGRKSG